MPRGVRFNVPGAVYHVISRFVDREWFIETEHERSFYLSLLGRALSESDWRCLAYAVMSNHIHLAMVAGETTMKSWVSRVHGPFAAWMNKNRGRLGPMFVRGPSDYETRDEHQGRLIAYIHNNPVRAGVVDYANQSTWTSHRSYVGAGSAPRWLHVAEGLARAGFGDATAFDQWVNAEPGHHTPVDLDQLRRELRKRGSIEIATPIIHGEMEAHVPIVARPWSHTRADPRRVIETTADEIGIDQLTLCSRRRAPMIVLGRRVAIHCGRALGLTGADIAAALGISQQAASRILQQHVDSKCRSICERTLARLQETEVEQVVTVP